MWILIWTHDSSSIPQYWQSNWILVVQCWEERPREHADPERNCCCSEGWGFHLGTPTIIHWGIVILDGTYVSIRNDDHLMLLKGLLLSIYIYIYICAPLHPGWPWPCRSSWWERSILNCLWNLTALNVVCFRIDHNSQAIEFDFPSTR